MILRVTRRDTLTATASSYSSTMAMQASSTWRTACTGRFSVCSRTWPYSSRGGSDPTVGTLVWPGDIDLAPEYLLFRALPNEPALQDLYVAWGYLSRRAAGAD